MKKYLNMYNLYSLFTNEINAFYFAIENNVIYNRMICDQCETNMTLFKDVHRKFQQYWKCINYKKTYSIFKYSIF